MSMLRKRQPRAATDRVSPRRSRLAQMLAATGVFMLWIGWYGFNPGSTGAVTHGKVTVSAHAALTTSLAAAASVFTCVTVRGSAKLPP